MKQHKGCIRKPNQGLHFKLLHRLQNINRQPELFFETGDNQNLKEDSIEHLEER